MLLLHPGDITELQGKTEEAGKKRPPSPIATPKQPSDFTGYVPAQENLLILSDSTESNFGCNEMKIKITIQVGNMFECNCDEEK